MTKRTAAEALEEVLALIKAHGSKGLASANCATAAHNFISAYAATLRAALAQPQELTFDEELRQIALEAGPKAQEFVERLIAAGNGLEPRGCPAPGACSCIPTPPQEGEVESRLDALFSEAFPTNHPAMHDYALLKMELKRLRATQSAAPAQGGEVETELKRVAEHLRQNQVDLPPEFAKVLRENYWELLSNGHSPPSTAGNTVGQAGLTVGPNFDGESPAQSAPTQEPIGRVERYTGDLHDMSVIVWLGEQPPEGTLLYAAPQPNEARELLLLGELQNIVNAKRFDREAFSNDTEFADWAQNRARHTLGIYAEEKHK